MAHASASVHMVKAYVAATKRQAPITKQDYDRSVVMDPAGVLADYLYWVTIAQWGSDGVPDNFWEAAKQRWPKLRSPHPPL
ncbi:MULTISPECIES: hypothetical protein [unclassified Mesorhizobium]|uniref:hypothetical protein n=1 Tax=unclassified Mesorhizobium TaxID=325217 RepID=UPI000FCBEAA1|nr:MULTISPECIES: hypothetical protein [unclassified Mesorhizobium]TGU56918.1 hypothetical protein EN791_029740 [Mesorhizobium sp. M2D.F.Ca.ET.148.01.1.1]TGU61299.1 hypothetical protein EN790_29760 [Mesorhizobium sp. M2D.F.Ca.ET.147.01.1.1]